MAPDGAVTINRTGPRGPGQTMPEVRGLDRLLPDPSGDLPWMAEGASSAIPWTRPYMEARHLHFGPVRRSRSTWARSVARASPPPCPAWGLISPPDTGSHLMHQVDVPAPGAAVVVGAVIRGTGAVDWIT